MSKNKLICILLASLILAFSACQQTETKKTEVNSAGASSNQIASNSANQNTTSSSNISANSQAITPSVSSVNSPVKRGKGIGKITKINLEGGSVELDHEEIPGMMPKMLMEFNVKDKKMLVGLKVGDTAEFVLEDNKGQEKIIEIKRKP